jgi:hypothetical protein
MIRLIIATAFFAAVALSFGLPAAKPAYIAGFHPPGSPIHENEQPKLDVLQQEWAKG